MKEFLDLVQGYLPNPYVRAALVVVVSIVVAKIVDFALCRILVRLTRRTKSDFDDRMIQLLHRPIFVSVVLLGLYLALRIIDLTTGHALVLGVIQTVLVLVWLFAGLKITSTFFDSVHRFAGRVQWLDARTVPLFDNTLKVVLVGAGAYSLFRAWKLDVTPMLASAGIAGIALGFAAKDTLANLFGGLFVIIDAPYKLGDWVNLSSGERGRVIKIGLRSTRLLTRDDIEVTLPNAQIANSTIVNESGGPYEKTRVSIVVGVAYGSDVDRVKQVLLDAARGVSVVAADPEPRIRFKEMGDSALVFRVLCWIDEPVLRGQCIDALNTAVYKRLMQENISIPFPQRDVHLYDHSRETAS